MAEVKILVEGTHKLIEPEKLHIWCTTSLIKTNKNIIVDPGSYISKDSLITALKKEGLKPEDIEIVILTHSHIDHTTNLSLFPKARLYLRFIISKYPGQFQEIDKGIVGRVDLLHEKIADEVEIVETPGHTLDHISVLVKTKKGKVMISGDALANEDFANLEKQPDPNFIYSVEKYNESRKKVLSMADYIIPGHGKMFKVKK